MVVFSFDVNSGNSVPLGCSIGSLVVAGAVVVVGNTVAWVLLVLISMSDNGTAELDVANEVTIKNTTAVNKFFVIANGA